MNLAQLHTITAATLYAKSRDFAWTDENMMMAIADIVEFAHISLRHKRPTERTLAFLHLKGFVYDNLIPETKLDREIVDEFSAALRAVEDLLVTLTRDQLKDIAELDLSVFEEMLEG